MPKDWGLKWKMGYIPKLHGSIMNKLLVIAIVVVIVGGVSTFALSTYFTESTIDEAIPTGALVQSEIKGSDTIAMNQGDTMMEEEMMKDDTMMEEEMMKDDTMMEEEMMKDDTMMEEEMMKTIPMSYAGEFVGVGDGVHDAQGNAYTIPLEDTSNVLRLENFKSTNGPDLYVYLSTDENASDFVNLGTLKASSGNQNYEIPYDTDLNKYNKVLIWCKAFGVLFGSAELSSK